MGYWTPYLSCLSPVKSWRGIFTIRTVEWIPYDSFWGLQWCFNRKLWFSRIHSIHLLHTIDSTSSCASFQLCFCYRTVLGYFCSLCHWLRVTDEGPRKVQLINTMDCISSLLFLDCIMSQQCTRCTSRMDLPRNLYVLPHWDISCCWNWLSLPVTVYCFSTDLWRGSH